MCSVEILIRLRECAGWSESLLGTHVLRYLFWRYDWWLVNHNNWFTVMLSMQLYLLDNHANILSAFINEKWHVHLVQNYQLMDTSNLVRLFTVSLWKPGVIRHPRTSPKKTLTVVIISNNNYLRFGRDHILCQNCLNAFCKLNISRKTDFSWIIWKTLKWRHINHLLNFIMDRNTVQKLSRAKRKCAFGAWAGIEGQDQTAHLIRAFAVHCKNHWLL